MKAAARLSAEEELKSFTNLRLPQPTSSSAPPDLDMLPTEDLRVGDKIYLVSSKWFKAWKAYASGTGAPLSEPSLRLPPPSPLVPRLVPRSSPSLLLDCSLFFVVFCCVPLCCV